MRGCGCGPCWLPGPGAPLPAQQPALFWGALAAALLLLAPPVALLGMVGPWTTRLLAATGLPVGRASGRTLAVSTAGSLLGTFAPTLWLIPAYGARVTVLGAAAVLALAALAVLGATRGRTGAAVALVLVLLGAGARLDRVIPIRGGPGLVREFESPYQYGRVVQRPSPATGFSERTLHLNEGGEDFHSKVVIGRALTGAYYDWYVPLAGLVAAPDPAARPPLRVAILGLAGGAHSLALHAFCDRGTALAIDGVEIDPVVVDVAEAFLGMDPERHPRLRVHVADARPWLAAAAGPFDLVILDAFAQQLYVPFHLATRECFALLHERLAPGGVLAFNVYPAEADGELLRAFAATLRAVFGPERVWGMRLPFTGGNFLVMARRDADLDRDALLRVVRTNAGHAERDRLWQVSAQLHRGLAPLPDGGVVLTDDHAPVEVMTERDLAKMRAALEAAR